MYPTNREIVSPERWNRSPTCAEVKPLTHVYKKMASCSSKVTYFESWCPMRCKAKTSSLKMCFCTPSSVRMRLGWPLGIGRGFVTRRGRGYGSPGVRVRVGNFVPSKNPYPQCRLRVFGGFFGGYEIRRKSDFILIFWYFYNKNVFFLINTYYLWMS